MKEFSIADNFDVIWERISEETGVKSFRQLAVIIDKTQPTISAAKAKGEFPPGWAYIIGKKFGLLTEWIMTGEGPKRLDELKGDLGFYEELEEWAKETGRSENTQWIRNQIESFYPMFTVWKKRKAEGGKDNSGFPSSKVA